MAGNNPEKTPKWAVILSASEGSPSMNSCPPDEILHPGWPGNDMFGVFSGFSGCKSFKESHFTQRVQLIELCLFNQYANKR